MFIKVSMQIVQHTSHISLSTVKSIQNDSYINSPNGCLILGKFTQSHQGSHFDVVIGQLVQGLQDVRALLHDHGDVILLAGGGDDGLTGHQLLDVVVAPRHDQHHLQQALPALGVTELGHVLEQSGLKKRNPS